MDYMKVLIACLLIVIAITPVSAITHYKFTSGSNTVEVWNNSITGSGTGFWLVPDGVTSINYVIVGGGGAGGSHYGGGGGAGGFLNGTLTVIPGDFLIFTVGIGGQGYSQASNIAAGIGGNTTLSYFGAPLDAFGGGGGARRDTGYQGTDGGSGGGGGGGDSVKLNPGYGQTGQGFRGGWGRNNAAASAGGGGGGNLSAGANASDNTGGNGGSGIANDITGTLVCYAGGGGGYGLNTLGLGNCGGGNASVVDNHGGYGTAGSGGGGGGSRGSSLSSTRGGNGGSGIAIISYTTPAASSGEEIQLMNPYLTVYMWRRTA